MVDIRSRLSAKAKATIKETRKNGEGLAICDITLLKLATLAGKGHINLSISWSHCCENSRSGSRYCLSVRARAHTMALSANYPKDPADRIIGATALVEGMTLVTADREIRRSKVVPTVW